MKILGIKFKNISSLLGEWDLRFDRPPFSDTGIFAITGPNGSGKSSILDALTLGLYGETARLKTPDSEITSWPAEESYAEVTFRVGEDVYRSRWWVRRGADTPMGPEMSLSAVNGEETVLEDRISRVRSRVAEVTGLDFKRFCRSVLLAQGEFAAFLNALESERAEILEKIIGAEMSRELEESVRNRAVAEQERLMRLRELAAGYPAIDRRQLEAIEEDWEQAQEALASLDRQLEDLMARKESLTKLVDLETSLQDAEEAQTLAENEWASVRKDLERLDKALIARPFADELRRIVSLGERADAARERLETVRGEVSADEARLREAEERLGHNREKLEDTRRRLESRREELADALRRDHDIEGQTRRFLETVSRYEALEASRKAMLQQQEDLKAKLAEARHRADLMGRSLERRSADAALDGVMERIEALAARLVEVRGLSSECAARLAETRKLGDVASREFQRAERAERRAREKADRVSGRKDELERQLAELLGSEDARSLAIEIQNRKQILSACRELLQIGHRYQEEGLASDVLGELERVNSRRQELESSLVEERTKWKELEDRILWRDTFRRLSAERSELRSGTPCPLCGALDHPFMEQGLPDLSDLNQTVEGIEGRIGAMEAELNELADRALRLSEQARTAEKLQNDWAAACERAGGSWGILDTQLIQDEIRSQESAIQHAKFLIRSTRWQKWRLAWLNMILGRRLQKLSRREKARNTRLQEHEAHQQALLDLEGRSRDLQEEETGILGDLAQLLQPFGERPPETGSETALLEQLRSRSATYGDERKRHQELTEELHALEKAIDSLASEVERSHAEAQALASETESIQATLTPMRAERESLYADLDPAGELRELEETINRLTTEQGELAQGIDALFQSIESKRRSLPGLEKDFEEVGAELETAEQELRERLVPAGIESIEAARPVLKALEQEESLRRRAVAVAQTLEEARSRAAAARETLDEARAKTSTSDTVEALEQRIASIQKAHEAQREKTEELERTLEERRRVDREYRETLRALEDQERVCAEVAADEKSLREENGAEIRKKLQRLMLDRLVEQSNAHLSLLSGRYLLRTVAEDGFAFEVEDMTQQRNHRSVRTLSGGEAFLVSLSLALGMSDLAAQHRRIESLFLDEGFGTLDEETLYRVMAALKGLRANGKMVGIISHVKRLADEIPTQIRVEREAGGRCRLTVAA